LMSCATPILPSGSLGHVAEITGHDPETAGHVRPKYARPSSTSSLLTGDRLNALVDDARARGLTVTDRLDRLAVETGSKSDE
ncbi:hypothetical protein, partial [Cupriavidus pampae]|uniref:hypothetical protein n=1 Tax=Cupriavidus pampae TaxID=659251 RepID=UPI001CC4D200